MIEIICDIAAEMLPLMAMMVVFAVGAIVADYVLPRLDIVEELIPWYK